MNTSSDAYERSTLSFSRVKALKAGMTEQPFHSSDSSVIKDHIRLPHMDIDLVDWNYGGKLVLLDIKENDKVYSIVTGWLDEHNIPWTHF